MTRFLVEAYTPATTEIADVEARARHVSDQLALAGTDVHYLSSIFVREDELCLHIVEAASVDVATELALKAGISPHRIVEATP